MDLFGQVGEIVSAKCVTGKGYGFVRFETVEMATQAIQEVNDLPFNGTTIRVKYADNKKGGGKGWDQSGGYDQSGSSPSDAGQGTPPWKRTGPRQTDLKLQTERKEKSKKRMLCHRQHPCRTQVPESS